MYVVAAAAVLQRQFLFYLKTEINRCVGWAIRLHMKATYPNEESSTQNRIVKNLARPTIDVSLRNVTYVILVFVNPTPLKIKCTIKDLLCPTILVKLEVKMPLFFK